ncbi:hypothetical protein COHA_002662 [Chlorella ohadii]|uniref:Uncharacterized protein n=1 Tax=Chlorella ohadii TaxID=2649997 RepID=A0AAD5E073_9CHLO|nr:hypothetical protein COHA_002662 [Chlorella ohadii]
MAWGKKSGDTARTADSISNKMLVWLGWLLATCGFGILLGGVASMQQYTWWITFLHWFVWLMVLIYLVTGLLHKTRIALVGLCAVAAVLLMDTANTYLVYNYIPGLSGTMATRTRVTVAGWDAEKDMYRHSEEHVTNINAVGTVPIGTATTTTTAMPAATAV